VAVVAGCSHGPEASTLIYAPMKTQQFCVHRREFILAVLNVIQGIGPKNASERLPTLRRLRAEFDEDEQLFRAVGDGQMAAVADDLETMLGNFVEGVESARNDDDWQAAAAQFDFSAIERVPEGFCLPVKRRYQWVGTNTMELQVPAEWRSFDRGWSDSVTGARGVLITAGLHLLASGASPFGSDYQWVFPNASLAASAQLTDELGLKGVRFAVALDRLREWMDAFDWSDDCELRGTAVYEKWRSEIYGFVRRWDDCGGYGSTLVEVYAIGLPHEAKTYVLVLRAYGRYPGDLQAVSRALTTFHLFH
jgi:hypothetical protein